MRPLLKILLFSLSISLIWLPAWAVVKGPVRISIDVPPGQWKTARLRSLPKDAVVAVKVESDGEILVGVVDTRGYLAYPKSSRPLFLGRVLKQLSFSVSIPEAGNKFFSVRNYWRIFP